ncbi:hypothetical protein J7J74_00915 [bacterium]|nr:hypothetical protein [bacterium]
MEKKLKISTVIILGIILLVIAGVCFLEKKNEQGVKINDKFKQRVKSWEGVQLPQDSILYDCLGKVVEKKENMLIIQTVQGVAESVDKIKVYITPKTEFTLLTLKKEGGQVLPGNEEKFSFSEIKVGDEVVVVTEEDVLGKTEIKALKVRAVKRSF